MHEIISKEIGSTLVTECLAYKIHKSILNFEGESDDNINSIRALDMKSKYQIQINSDKKNALLSRVDGNFSLVVLSLNPNSF
jgi:hypothetical protein